MQTSSIVTELSVCAKEGFGMWEPCLCPSWGKSRQLHTRNEAAGTCVYMILSVTVQTVEHLNLWRKREKRRERERRGI